MNATLSLHNREPSRAEQARRLEFFEIALREERIAELEQERDTLINTIINKLKLQDGDVLQVTEGSFPLLSELAKAVNSMNLKNVLFICGDINQLDEEAQRTIAKPFIDQLETDLSLYMSKLKNSNEREDESYQRETKLRLMIKDAEAEIKRLRALDPERLKAQVKRLQKEKATAAEGTQELRVRNQQLAKQNRQLNIALDKAIADANAGMELKPAQIFEQARLGRWELFTCAKDGWYQILDTENEVSQTVRVEAGNLITPKMRPVPKAIAAEVLKFHQEYFGGAA